MENEQQNPDWIEKYFSRIIILLLVFAFISPVVYFQLHLWFDFSNTCQIGDTFGGLTAPFLNLMGAALVYLLFTKQRKANIIQINTLQDVKELFKNQQKETD